jgi:hypothetical protein
VSDSTWRLPIAWPVVRAMAEAASSNEPRDASIAASLRMPWEWALAGKVQSRVGPMQVDVPAVAVSEPAHPDRAEDCCERTDMANFHSPVANALGVGDLRSLLAHRTQVQLGLVHLAQQLPTTLIERLFELGVGHGRGLGPLQPPDQLLETGPRTREGTRGHLGDTHLSPP